MRDAYAQLLQQDASFAQAVRSNDVGRAALQACHFFKAHLSQFIRDYNEQRSGSLDLAGDGADGATPGGRMDNASPALKQREIKPGEWMTVTRKNQTMDPELLGHSGQVLLVEPNGWVELHLPKLGPQGRTIKMQQRYLAPFNAGPPVADAGSKRGHHFDSYVRPPGLGQPLPPAKVAILVGKNVTKARDVARAVRRDMLSLEEVVPWEYVEAGWRARRPAWRKALRSLESHHKSTDSQVPVVAAAMVELHEALLTDKSLGAGVLARGGPWETRLRELADGGNNYQCLQMVWDEMHEAVRHWLHSNGQALPTALPAYHPHSLAAGPVQYPQAAAGGPALGAHGYPPQGLDRACYAAALTAFQALEAGAAAGQCMLSQVAVDRILSLGSDAYAGLKALLAREEAHVMATLDALASSVDLASTFGLTAGEVAQLSDADVVSLLAASPQLRADLRLVRGLESEPDTDAEGGDATDMSDSGSE